MGLQPGKLPHSLLARLIRYSGARDPRVILGSRIGEDAAVIDMGNRCLVLKTDPITYAIDEIGYYAVHVNANDIATMGARPTWFQVSLLLPRTATEKGVEEIFRQISETCKKLGIAVTGGHTEITPWIDRPIVVGDMHGICRKSELVFSSGARVGDAIVLTKGAGIEGTATIAREKRNEIGKKLPVSLIRKASNFLFDPGISVVPEASIATKHGANSMHDPTEGGVAVGLYELATASNKGLLIEREEVIVRKETRILCELFHIDPLGLLGSGALLVTMPVRKAEQCLDSLSKAGIDASMIGRITKKSDGMKIRVEGKKQTLRFSQKDEILKVL